MAAGALAAHADSSPSEVYATYDTARYAYVNTGEQLALSFTAAMGAPTARTLTYTAVDPSGVQRWSCTLDFASASPADTCAVSGLKGTAGVWTITQKQSADAGSPAAAWDIEVTSATGTAISGRTWTYDEGLLQSSRSAPADIDYWFVNDMGYQYALGLSGYNGVGSRIRADAVGNRVSLDSCVSAYKSVEISSTGPASGTAEDCGSYKLFYAKPDPAMPASAASAAGVVSVLPKLLSSASLVTDGLAFTPAAAGSRVGSFAYELNQAFAGNYSLDIDVDGNGSYADAVDRHVALAEKVGGTKSYAFDGLDGKGAAIASCEPMNARLYFDRIGEIHLVMRDVEGRTGGLSLTRLNGAGAPDDRIYWNDTDLVDGRDQTPRIDGTAGVPSAAGVHGWDFGAGSWGDSRLIDDWSYSSEKVVAGELAIEPDCPAPRIQATKTSDVEGPVWAGQIVTYTLTYVNSGNAAGTVDSTDDLAGVLDDATLVSEPVSHTGGVTAAINGKAIRVEGELAAGASATVTYQVRVNGTPERSDSILGNVLVPDDPSQCAEGACETVHPVASLAIAKTSTASGDASVGDIVNYTVKVSNTGGFNFTEDVPASAVDDLSGVLDDATYQDDVQVTAGETSYSAPLLSWSGPIPAGESVDITYSVRVTGTGDGEMLNTATLPAEFCPDAASDCAATVKTPIAPPAAGGLAATGLPPMATAVAATLLLTVGGGVLILRRRRTDEAAA